MEDVSSNYDCGHSDRVGNAGVADSDGLLMQDAQIGQEE